MENDLQFVAVLGWERKTAVKTYSESTTETIWTLTLIFN